MKSPKSPQKTFPTTTDLRAKDPRALRAEIDLLRARIAERIVRDPLKAAVILTDWVTAKKKAA